MAVQLSACPSIPAGLVDDMSDFEHELVTLFEDEDFCGTIHSIARRTMRLDPPDFMQDLFELAWKKRAKYTPGNLGGWLYGLAITLRKSQLRKLTRRDKRLSAYTPPENVQVDSFEPAPTVIDIASATSTWSAYDVDLARMHLDGLNLKESAQRLGLTHGAARARWSRLQKKLRESCHTSDPL
jgi:DNA-directed RNA polymerase specialized sigma24 family protein